MGGETAQPTGISLRDGNPHMPRMTMPAGFESDAGRRRDGISYPPMGMERHRMGGMRPFAAIAAAILLATTPMQATPPTASTISATSAADTSSASIAATATPAAAFPLSGTITLPAKGGHGGGHGGGHSHGHSGHSGRHGRSSGGHGLFGGSGSGKSTRGSDGKGHGEGTHMDERKDGTGTYRDTSGRTVPFRPVHGTGGTRECDANGDGQYTVAECKDMPRTRSERLPGLVALAVVALAGCLGGGILLSRRSSR